MRTGFYRENETKETSVGSIPQDWDVARLDQVARLIMGQSPPSSTYNREGDGLPFLQGKMEFGDIYPNPAIYCSEPLRLAEQNDVLMSVRAPVGDVNLTPFKLCIGRGLTAIRFDRKIANHIFYFYVLQLLKRTIEGLGKGSTFKALVKADLTNFSVVLPPQKEQEAIAEILSKIDETIQKTKEIIAKSELLKKGLMQELLIKGIGHEEFKDTAIGKIPKDWRLIKLGGIISSGPQNGIYKHMKYYGDGVPIIRIESFGFGRLGNDKDLKRVRLTNQELATYSLELDDIVLNRVNSIEFVGKSILIRELLEPTVFESNMMRFKLDDKKADPQFIATYLNSDFAMGYLRSNAKRAVHQASVNQGDVRSVPLSLPPLDEQKRIAGILSSVQKKLELEMNERANLERAKRGLMDLLLTGRIRIKVD